MRGLVILSLVGLLLSCSPSTQPKTSTQNYEEDLSAYRPEVPVLDEQVESGQTVPVVEVEYTPPTHHLRTEIDSVLAIKASLSEQKGYLQGFTIQVYTGRSREQANNAKNTVYDILLDERATVFYDQPMFRVKVGRYYTRLEAEKNLNLLKDSFPQALVLPERISLDR